MLVDGAQSIMVDSLLCEGCEFAPQVDAVIDDIACAANQNQKPGVGVDMMEQFFVRRPNQEVADKLVAETRDAVSRHPCANPTTPLGCTALTFVTYKSQKAGK